MTARRAAAFLLAAGLLVPVAACSSEESQLDSEAQEDGDKMDQDMGSELDEDDDENE